MNSGKFNTVLVFRHKNLILIAYLVLASEINRKFAIHKNYALDITYYFFRALVPVFVFSHGLFAPIRIAPDVFHE